MRSRPRARARLFRLDALEQLVGIGPRRRPCFRSLQRIECQIQLQHVDARLADARPATYPRVCAAINASHARAAAGRARAPRAPPGTRAAATLMCGIEPAGGGRDQVDRHGRAVAGIGRAQRRDARLDRIGQRRIERPEVGAAGGRAVVRLRRGRRRAAPEVLRVAEVLADERRADGRAVAQRSGCRRPARETASRAIAVTTSG